RVRRSSWPFVLRAGGLVRTSAYRYLHATVGSAPRARKPPALGVRPHAQRRIVARGPGAAPRSARSPPARFFGENGSVTANQVGCSINLVVGPRKGQRDLR